MSATHNFLWDKVFAQLTHMLNLELTRIEKQVDILIYISKNQALQILYLNHHVKETS